MTKKFLNKTADIHEAYGRLTRDEIVARLDEALRDVPEDVRAEARFELECDYEYSPILRLHYGRYETDAEEQAREASEKREAEQQRIRREISDRETYERLKAKFEGGK